MREGAALAETETVTSAVFMLAVSGRLAATARMVAVKTHVFGVVNLVSVLAVSDLLLRRSFGHELRQFCFKLK